MKFFKSKIYYIVILLLFPFASFAQDEDRSEILTGDIEGFLPPLQTLIDSAIINNPEIKFRTLQVRVNEFKLSSERSYWTRNVGMQTDIRYGTFNNFSTNVSEGQTPSLVATNVNQTNYGVGLYIKFPLYDVVNRKNQIGLAQAEVEQAVSMAEFQKKEVRQFVIQQYNDVVLKQRLFKNKTRSIETSRLNLSMVEEEFINGVTPVVEYSRIHQMTSIAEDDLERARMEFINSLMILEELVGFEFNIINTTNLTDENN